MISVVAVGSRGDVVPMVGLAAQLRQELDVDVRVATLPAYESLVLKAGAEFFPITIDLLALLADEEGQSLLTSGGNRIKQMRQLIKVAKPEFAKMLVEIADALSGSELIIYAPLTSAAASVGESLGVPSLLVQLQPMLFGSKGYASAAVNPVNLPGPLQRVYDSPSYFGVRQSLWQPFRTEVQSWRGEILGLPKLPFLGPFGKVKNSQVLNAYSSVLAPGDSSRPNWHTTGAWQSVSSSKPVESGLRDFCSERPTIYVGFGSMLDVKAVDIQNMVNQLAGDLDVNVVLASEWDQYSSEASGERVRVISCDISHAELFDLVDVVVHHGGAGTTIRALRHGRPSVIVPYFADQIFWGERLYKIGMPKPIARKKLTLDILKNRVEQARTAESRSLATMLREKVKAEPGEHEAVEIIAPLLA